MVRQRVHILSNVDLCLPGLVYEHLESLEQVVNVANTMHGYDMENNCKTCILVGDRKSKNKVTIATSKVISLHPPTIRQSSQKCRTGQAGRGKTICEIMEN